MRYSQTLIPTVKEVPADAQIPSHQLMIRAGLIRPLASGTYIYLPAGQRSLLKIQQIVREEMDKSGALEVLMPSVQPLELWQKTGRDVDYGETMCKFVDRHGRKNVLSPTAEEVAATVSLNEINSYKQLPINIYQISFKFRDEFRPRFGVLRSREFIMKDAYSFNADPESLEQTYRVMYDAYCSIFKRCGVEYVIVEAETGEMGGSGSHQFTVPCESGEDVIVYSPELGRAWNIEKAPVDAIAAEEPAENPGQIDYVHTPATGSIEAVCEFLKTTADRLIKTLVYATADEEVVIAMVRGDHEVNIEKLTQTVGKGRLELADEETVERITGAKVGFAGPVSLKVVPPMYIDHAVAGMSIAYAGANKSDYHIRNVVPGRDFELSGENIFVGDIRDAVEGDTFEGQKLLFKRGIEVGQVFKLGDKYTSKMGVSFLDENGKATTPLMGCYGIGINRIMASAIELGHDDDGIIWPITIAPWEVILTTVGKDEEVIAAGDAIYEQLKAAGVDVLYDDRNARGGVKFKDADLLGIPVRVTIGKKTLAEGQVEIKLRRESDSTKVSVDTAAEETAGIVARLKAECL